MLPDVVRPGGIGKTVMTRFGGIDLRPDAEDWTLFDTENMTPAKWPRLAARDPRPESNTERDPVTHMYTEEQYFNTILGVDDVLISVRGDGYIYSNDWRLCQAAEQSPEVRLCRFGRKVIILHTREMINLEWHLLGRKADESELPGSPAEGDAWVVGDPGDSGQHIWRYEGGAWADKGLLLEPLEASVSLTAMDVVSGLYQNTAADMNTIRLGAGQTGVDFTKKFQPGDAVTISGCTVQPRNNITATVREVSENELRFYENTFTMRGLSIRHVGEGGLIAGSIGMKHLYQVTGFFDDGGSGDVYFTLTNNVAEGGWLEYWSASGEQGISVYDEDGTLQESVTPTDTYDPETIASGPNPLVFEEDTEAAGTGGYTEYNVNGITISKQWPEGLQNVFEHSNRLWGWKDRTIYASNLGDAGNWNRFDGLADDAWSVTIQRPEPITGGISVHGMPTFFTEERRFQVYGSAPAEYQLAEQDCHGVRKGCDRAMAVVDGVLFYPSRFGIMADSGAIPESCSQALGELRLSGAVGGGFGHEYWISGEADGVQSGQISAGDLYTMVYDTRSGIWIRDGEQRFLSFAAAGGRFYGVRKGEGAGASPPNPLTVLHGDAPWQGFFIDEDFVEWRLVTNVFTQEEPNRKRVHRIQIRAELATGSGLTVKIRYDSSGNWNTVWTVAGDNRRKSWYLPVLIRRCDHFMLWIEGSGGCVIHSIALETRKGSAIF